MVKLKHYWQDLNSASCGPLSVLSILEYFGIKKPNGRRYTLASLTKLLKVSKELGAPQESIIAFLVSVGLTTKLISYEELPAAIAAEHPVIALFKAEDGDGHYSNVCDAVKNEKGEVITYVFQDSGFGPLVHRDPRTFKEQLKYGNNWLLEVWRGVPQMGHKKPVVVS